MATQELSVFSSIRRKLSGRQVFTAVRTMKAVESLECEEEEGVSCCIGEARSELAAINPLVVLRLNQEECTKL